MGFTSLLKLQNLGKGHKFRKGWSIFGATNSIYDMLAGPYSAQNLIVSHTQAPGTKSLSHHVPNLYTIQAGLGSMGL